MVQKKIEAFKIVEAEGSHYDIGFQLGTKCKDLAKSMMNRVREDIKASKTNLEKSILEAKKHLPYVIEFCPECVEEIRGYTDGAELKFDEVFSWFCSEAPADSEKGCTDIAASGDVTADGSVFAVHNEDWYVQDAKHLTLVRVKPRGEPSFLAMSYGGIWINSGVNSAGISLTGNALTHKDTRIGIPEDFAVRKVLASKTIGDALKAAVPEKRGSSYNNIVCDSNGEIYSMEGSATDFDALYACEGYLVHTNHYLSQRMAKYEGAFETKHDKSPFKPDSIIRYNRALRLFKKELGKVTVDTFKKIMSDHVNFPWSICRHLDETLPPRERSKTIFSEIIDLTHLTMWVCRGNPCVGEYKKYGLEE